MFGIGLLFLLIILLAVVSVGYINTLEKGTGNILTANYNTLQYSRNMLQALDEENSVYFLHNLGKQENDITEVGERQLTQQLAADFSTLQSHRGDTTIKKTIRKDILGIMHLNMLAIKRKSEQASQTAKTAKLWVSIVGTFCFIIAFISWINLPMNIADPIKELTESIRQIAAQKYQQRVHFEAHGEFGELARSFNTMAQRLEEYANSNLARILIEKKRIEMLVNKMHDPIIGLDENKKILFINDEALNISGLTKDQIIGRTIGEVAARNDLIRTLMQDITTADKTDKTDPVEIKIYADNKESYFEKEVIHILITPPDEQIPRLMGYVIILRNVTVYKELDFAKTNFIAMVSHEFKTPISSIKMSLQLLGNEQIGKVNEEQKNLLESIRQDTDRLLKITTELLNMAQVETGNIQLSVIPADPKEILMYAVNANRTQANQKQIKLEISCPDHLPNVEADAEKTSWVLINLISNAIRYSYDNSTIFLAITLENKHIRFSVKDTGQGIAPQYKYKVFDRYFRIPGTKEKGIGLGLAISKEFIEAQGGRITVDSELGIGSTFTIILNVAV